MFEHGDWQRQYAVLMSCSKAERAAAEGAAEEWQEAWQGTCEHMCIKNLPS